MIAPHAVGAENVLLVKVQAFISKALSKDKYVTIVEVLAHVQFVMGQES